MRRCQGRGEAGSLALHQQVEFNSVIQPIALILVKRNKEGTRTIMIKSNSRRG